MTLVSNRTILVYPSIDAIQDLKFCETATVEFGQAMGAVITLVTKGRNQPVPWRSILLLAENDALNATTTSTT